MRWGPVNKKYDVLCLGLIVADVLVRPVSKGIFDVETTIADSIDVMTGGDAMNEAIVLSRLGVKAGLAGKVGNDAFGELLLREAQKSGVDVSNVSVDSSVKTSTSIVLVNKDGDRNFVYCRGGSDFFSLEDIDLSIVRQAKIVSLASIFALPMLEGGGAEAIFKEAKANGAITVADIIHDIYGVGLQGVKGVLGYTDIFIPNYMEAVYLTGEKEPDRAAEALLDLGIKTVVIKLGAKGCYIKTREESHLIDAYEAQALDTTGAGDNFVAGFLTGILHGWDIKKCGLFANAVGAICVGKVGATTAVRNMDQVLEFMGVNKVDWLNS